MSNHKTIAVSPETHAKAQTIAKANGRTLGGQVAAWAKECSHPSIKLVKVGHTVVTFGGEEIGTVEQPVNIVQCQLCGALIVLPGNVFDASARAVAVETGA